jgi:hypothetical protein
MPQKHDTRHDGVPYQTSVVIDALLHNGVDSMAARRARMRELTAARQAAEQCQSRQALAAAHGQEHDGVIRERTAALYAELARLNAEHLAWQHEQGEDEPEHPTPRRMRVSHQS